MTTLQNLITKSIIIARLVQVSGYKTAYATVTAAIAEIQPLSAQKTQLVDGVMGKTFMCYTDPDVDIQEHDKLREVNTGNIYKVKTGGVSRRTFGSLDFLSVIMEQVN